MPGSICHRITLQGVGWSWGSDKSRKHSPLKAWLCLLLWVKWAEFGLLVARRMSLGGVPPPPTPVVSPFPAGANPQTTHPSHRFPTSSAASCLGC